MCAPMPSVWISSMTITLSTIIIMTMSSLVDGSSVTYSAPRDGLSEMGMAYQLGIWSAILIFSIAIYAFYALASMDYSGDTVLFVEIESAAKEE